MYEKYHMPGIAIRVQFWITIRSKRYSGTDIRNYGTLCACGDVVRLNDVQTPPSPLLMPLKLLGMFGSTHIVVHTHFPTTVQKQRKETDHLKSWFAVHVPCEECYVTM